MKANIPAIRYETFIEAFEKAVHASQQEIKALEAGQLEYLACVDAIKTVNIPNDGRLALVGGGAHINITALPTDRFDTFNRLALEVGRCLVTRRLRENPTPSLSLRSTWYPDLRFGFNTKRPSGGMGHVGIDIRIPTTGTKDIAVDTKTEVSEQVVYQIVLGAELRQQAVVVDDNESIAF